MAYGWARWWLRGVALTLLGSCGPAIGNEDGAAPTGQDSLVPLPAWSDFGGEDAFVGGRLQGSPHIDGGCVWLEDAGSRFAVLWPPGYSARFDPLRLVNERGDVIAREGDLIRSGGGNYIEPMERCGVAGDHVLRLQEPKVVDS